MWTATPSTTRRVCHLGDTCPVSLYRPAPPVPIPRAAVRQQAHHMTVTAYFRGEGKPITDAAVTASSAVLVNCEVAVLIPTAIINTCVSWGVSHPPPRCNAESTIARASCARRSLSRGIVPTGFCFHSPLAVTRERAIAADSGNAKQGIGARLGGAPSDRMKMPATGLAGCAGGFSGNGRCNGLRIGRRAAG